MKMISIGFGNLVSAERIVSVITPDSAPLKRLVQDAKDSGRAVDATCGRKTRAVIITDSEHVILSALTAETVVERIEGTNQKSTAEEHHE